MTEPEDYTLANARIVLADRIVHGAVEVSQGRIAEVREGVWTGGHAYDMQGDYLIPGLVELHTDHLESHFVPRAKVKWNPVAAVVSYDAQIAASGIATVFDSLRVGAASDSEGIAEDLQVLAGALDEARGKGLLRADHLTHLRCEIATHDVVAMAQAYFAGRRVHLVSIMDHTPGQRQFRDLVKMREFYARNGFITGDAFDAFCADRMAMHARHAVANRRALVAVAHAGGAALASHDDATLAQVAEAAADRVAIAEFPTTVEAAAASHAAGIKVLMGAPNIVRGGSHSGNVAAVELARAGVLDILSSDYVPASLLLAAFELPERAAGVDLASAIRMVTKNPAEATGLSDRGEIVAGRRADLARVAADGHVPVVRSLWREGRRVV